MDKETIERLHKSGLMPDWAYYQQNGKSPIENLQEQHKKIMDKYRRKKEIDRELEIYKARRKAEIDAELEKQIETEVAPEIEKAIDNLFKGWQ